MFTVSVGVITRKVWKCDRCDHEWLSRDGEKPLRCASCKSPYWNKLRKITDTQSVMKKGGKL